MAFILLTLLFLVVAFSTVYDTSSNALVENDLSDLTVGTMMGSFGLLVVGIFYERSYPNEEQV